MIVGVVVVLVAVAIANIVKYAQYDVKIAECSVCPLPITKKLLLSTRLNLIHSNQINDSIPA